MNECERIARQLEKALHGEAWHGPSWEEVLDRVTRKQALHRPIPGAHTIAEIVLHMTSWHDIVRRRFAGEVPQVTAEEDWPKASLRTDAAWKAAVARLFETGGALRKVIARFPVAKLHTKRPRTNGTWYDLALGQLQHDLYHAGQVAVLRKAKVRARK